jgi:hypothetical protein
MSSNTTNNKIKIEQLDFEIIRLPQQKERFEEIQPVLTEISFEAAPNLFRSDTPYFPMEYIFEELTEVVIIIGYHNSKPVVYMSLVDKDEIEKASPTHKTWGIRRGGLNTNETAWYLADINGLHQKYCNMGKLIMNFFKENILYEKDYALSTSHLNPFFGWKQIGLFKKWQCEQYYNYRIMSDE